MSRSRRRHPVVATVYAPSEKEDMQRESRRRRHEVAQELRVLGSLVEEVALSVRHIGDADGEVMPARDLERCAPWSAAEVTGDREGCGCTAGSAGAAGWIALLPPAAGDDDLLRPSAHVRHPRHSRGERRAGRLALLLTGNRRPRRRRPRR